MILNAYMSRQEVALVGDMYQLAFEKESQEFVEKASTVGLKDVKVTVLEKLIQYSFVLKDDANTVEFRKMFNELRESIAELGFVMEESKEVPKDDDEPEPPALDSSGSD